VSKCLGGSFIAGWGQLTTKEQLLLSFKEKHCYFFHINGLKGRKAKPEYGKLITISPFY